MSKKSILEDIKYVLEEIEGFPYIQDLIERFNDGEIGKEEFIKKTQRTLKLHPDVDRDHDIFEKIKKATNIDIIKRYINLDGDIPGQRNEAPYGEAEKIRNATQERLAEKNADLQDRLDQETAEIKEAKNQRLTELFIAGTVIIASIIYMERRMNNFNKKGKRSEFKKETKELQDKAQIFRDYDGLNDAAGVVPYAIYANTDYMIESVLRNEEEKKDFYYVIYSGLEYSRENFFKDNKSHPFLKDLKSDRLFRETDILVKRKKDIHKEVHYLLTKRSKITEKEFDSVLTNSDRSIKKINEIRERHS